MIKIQECPTSNNSYDTNDPCAIVFHNTDNFSETATARAHAEGLRDGYMQGMSWHVVVDDKEAFHCIPYKRGAWHVGVNYGGQLFGKINNRNSICVEMCVNAGSNYEHAFLNSVDVVKQLMAKFNIPAERVYSHYDICGKNCPSQVRARGDWDRFKKLVGAARTEYDLVAEIVVDKLYRVRKTWADSMSQTNAFHNLNLAKADADRHPGYSVFDENGIAVYTSSNPKEIYTQAEWIAMIAPIAQDLARKYGVLAEVLIAQTILESGWGSTDLARRYNILGMKASLINGTWSQFSTWSGEIYRKQTTEYVNGKLTRPYDDFRVYHSFRECMEDYVNFLLHVQNSKGYKYRRIQGWTDPLSVISAIRIGTGTNEKPEGYFTDPDYVTKIMNLINSYNLDKYHVVMEETAAGPQQTAETAAISQQAEVDRYAVLRSLDEVQFRIGLFHVLDNAKTCADINWLYKVFDIITGELVYEPVLTMVEKLIGKCMQFDQYVQWDNAAGDWWAYWNTKRSKSTFWKTRIAKLFITNCMGAVSFAMQDIGIPATALRWYGTKGGVHFLDDKARKEAEKYFDFIEVKKKTVDQCIADGTIIPGDTITYMTMSHTNIYLGVGLSYDGGHAFCRGSGEGARYEKWIGPTPYGSAKVATVVRIKDGNRRLKTVYRVQINAFDSERKAIACKARCKKKTGLEAFHEKMEDGKWHVFCGSFDSEDGAEERKVFVREHGYPKAFIKRVNI